MVEEVKPPRPTLKRYITTFSAIQIALTALPLLGMIDTKLLVFPPIGEGEKSFAVLVLGLAGAAAILPYVSTRGKARVKLAALFLAASVVLFVSYFVLFQRFVIGLDVAVTESHERVVIGYTRTPFANRFPSSTSDEDLEKAAGIGNEVKMWSRVSLTITRSALVLSYTLLLISLNLCIGLTVASQYVTDSPPGTDNVPRVSF